MSMFDDVLGFGRTSVAESMEVDTLEPEIAGMSLEEAADIDEDPMDFMLSVAYENEMNMMNLNAAIVAEEYIYLRENGEEMVTEAGKIESIISRAKQMITKSGTAVCIYRTIQRCVLQSTFVIMVLPH